MEQLYMSMDNSIGYDIYSLIARKIPGLVGVETASGYWGLSSFNIGNTILLINDNTQDNNGYFVEFTVSELYVPNVNKENIIKLSDKTFITDREQTVCDMIRYNRHEYHLYETIISAYEYGEVNVERLENIAKRYGILDRLHETYTKALQEIDWDNE